MTAELGVNCDGSRHDPDRRVHPQGFGDNAPSESKLGQMFETHWSSCRYRVYLVVETALQVRVTCKQMKGPSKKVVSAIGSCWEPVQQGRCAEPLRVSDEDAGEVVNCLLDRSRYQRIGEQRLHRRVCGKSAHLDRYIENLSVSPAIGDYADSGSHGLGVLGKFVAVEDGLDKSAMWPVLGVWTCREPIANQILHQRD
jgi:hypothetical protein